MTSTSRTEILNVHHVQIGCPPERVEELRDFYVSALGLAIVAKPASLIGRGGAWLRADSGIELHLGSEPGFAPSTKAHPAFCVRDLAVAVACFLAAGGLAVPDDALLPEFERAQCVDPVGNRIELLSPVG